MRNNHDFLRKKCVTCDYPIHMDTYRGCEHGCLYCRVRKKYAIGKVTPMNNVKQLRNFIEGKRNDETKWCDWNIPLQWGANSDPFQPCEREYGASLECLKVFAETGYPFIITTKNPVMLTEQPYFDVISQCNVVLQCSMACSRYDKIEPNVPKYEDRLKAMKQLSKVVKRSIVRLAPYFLDAFKNVIEEIPRWADAGIHGVVTEGFCSQKPQPQMVRINSTFFFSNDDLYRHYVKIREKCHECGLEFTCAEDGLTWLSDSTVCCGTAGLDGFIPHTYNADHIAVGDAVLTESMKQVCPQPFKCIGQSQAWALHCKGKTFKELVDEQAEKHIMFRENERRRLNVQRE